MLFRLNPYGHNFSKLHWCLRTNYPTSLSAFVILSLVLLQSFFFLFNHEALNWWHILIKSWEDLSLYLLFRISVFLCLNVTFETEAPLHFHVVAFLKKTSRSISYAIGLFFIVYLKHVFFKFQLFSNFKIFEISPIPPPNDITL